MLNIYHQIRNSFIIARPSFRFCGSMATTISENESIQKTDEKNCEPRPDYPWKKAKKCVLMLSFCGKNYYGMQRNLSMTYPTIEEELLKSLLKVGSIPQEWYDHPQKCFFQRASRTDKGVSAAKMIVSLKLLYDSETIDKVNLNLPTEIKLQDIKKVTKNFNSKNSCDARTYLYLTPTFAFCPIDTLLTESYRIDENTRKKVNDTLKEFIGAKYYHNYTSGKLPQEPSCQRYIQEFEIGEPFVKENLEFAVIKIKGQSFMLHQIRKMIGMTIAVVRGYASKETIDLTFTEDRVDVPRAPGLGLLLDEVHYERYNKRFGKDGIHSPLTWDHVADFVEKFKEDYIFQDIIETEKQSKNMLEWMGNLALHSYKARHFEETTPTSSAMAKVKRDLDRLRDKNEDESEENPEIEES